MHGATNGGAPNGASIFACENLEKLFVFPWFVTHPNEINTVSLQCKGSDMLENREWRMENF